MSIPSPTPRRGIARAWRPSPGVPRWTALGTALTCVLGILAAPMANAAPAAAPAGNAPGPAPDVQVKELPASAASYPFGAADHQLKPQNLAEDGYVEEEFQFSGKANVYDWASNPADGAVVRTPDVPYTTRV